MVWLIPGKLFKVPLFSVTSYFLILFISNCCVPTLPFKTERFVNCVQNGNIQRCTQGMRLISSLFLTL